MSAQTLRLIPTRRPLFGASPFGEGDDVSLVFDPTIENVPLPVANTEVDHTLPMGTKTFIIQNRDTGLLKLALTDTESGTTYLTIFPGCFYCLSGIDVKSLTLHIQSPSASQTVEISSWK